MDIDRIETIIFSRDRAMQLNLLLDSIVQFDTKKLLDINILYFTSSSLFKQGYEKLKLLYPKYKWYENTAYSIPNYTLNFNLLYWHNYYSWLKYKHLRNNKTNFKDLLVDILSKSPLSSVMFLTDDSFFYRNIEMPNVNDRISSISLRHGAQLTGGKYETFEDHIEWDVYQNDFFTDWGYPFSIDGHIYDRNIILKIARKLIFNNPNSFEGNVVGYVKSHHLFPSIAAMKTSCLVGTELNRVQTIVDNNHKNISQELMNNYFLDGYTLKILFDKDNPSYFRPDIQVVSVEKENNRQILYHK